MRLLDLSPQFLRRVDDRMRHYVDTLIEADGVDFLCPKCFIANNGEIGTHHVQVWFRGRVPDSETPGPGRWGFSGVGYADLTLSPSILLMHGCQWHGFVTAGSVTP